MTHSTEVPSKGMNIGLWAVQVILGLMFTGIGLWKAFTAIPDLAAALPWVADWPRLVRFIGITELLGGIGLILPAATGIRPKLTGLAGVGLTVVMVLAAGFHLSRGEAVAVPVNVVIGGLAAFVGWGRLVRAPIKGRE